MAAKILKRILSSLLTLLLVSLVVFAALSLSKGDSSAFVLAEDADEAVVEAYRERNGLNTGFFPRYLQFLCSFVTLDWGRTAGGQSIRTVIFSRLPVTLALAFWSILFSFVFSLFLSLRAVRKKGSPADRAVDFLSALFLVLPSFLSSLLLVLLFSILLKWFPVSGYSRTNEGIFRHFRTLFLPSLTLAFLHSSLMMRLFREALEENLGKPFARTALGKGVKRKNLPRKTALKPSLPVIFSVLAESLGSALGGAAVVENVFALPGMGNLLVQSALSRDARTSGVVLLCTAGMVILTFLLLDIVSFLVDPRERRADDKA